MSALSLTQKLAAEFLAKGDSLALSANIEGLTYPGLNALFKK